jgi:hypothetical protein
MRGADGMLDEHHCVPATVTKITISGGAQRTSMYLAYTKP